MRIGIVNDLAMAREGLRRVVVSSGHHEVIWQAADGAEAVACCAAQRPDLILMDLFMPVMDGVDATRRIMAEHPCAIVIVTASVIGHAAKVFEAMGAGALDAVNTPLVEGGDEGAQALLHKIDIVHRLVAGAGRASIQSTPAIPRPRSGTLPLVALGASTGGPAALAEVLQAMPAELNAAIVIIQHVDPQFVESLGEWLQGFSRLPVRLARKGDRPQAGQVLIAGTADHLVLRADGSVDYEREPAAYPYRPSVNVFLESMAAHWRGPGVAVLMTGMGRDGAQGLLALRRKGGFITVAQNQASCAVYGMPKAAVECGAAEHVLSLADIPAFLLAQADPHAPSAEAAL